MHVLLEMANNYISCPYTPLFCSFLKIYEDVVLMLLICQYSVSSISYTFIIKMYFW